MSMETWASDWQNDKTTLDNERYQELRNKEELLEKLIDRIEDVLEAYGDDDDIIDFKKDIKYEIVNVKEELE